MKTRLASNIIRTFSTQIGCQLIGILSGIVIARMIGPEGKGFASYAATAVSLVSVFFYGFADAVIYQFGKQKHSARAVHDAAMRFVIIALAIVVFGFVLIATIAPSQRPLAIAAIALPFALYVQIITPFLLVREEISFTNVRAVTQSLGTALFTIPLLVFTHLGLNGVLAVWILFNAVAAFQSRRAVEPILASSPVIPGGVPKELAREQLRFGLRAAGGSAAGFLNLRIDVFVVSVMFSAAALGWYTMAIASGEMLWQVSRAFVWPALGRIGSSTLSDSAALVARLTRNILAIVGFFGVIAFITGPWLIVHVYGAAFAPAGAALRWALPGLVAYAAEVALTQFMVLQLARPLAMAWIQLGAAGLCAALTVIFAARFGIVAAAASTSFTYLLVTGVLSVLFVRGTGIPLQRLLIIQREDLVHYSGAVYSALRVFKHRPA